MKENSDWIKFEAPTGVSRKPTQYWNTLLKLEFYDPTHTIGKGCVKKITPLNKHWHELAKGSIGTWNLVHPERQQTASNEIRFAVFREHGAPPYSAEFNTDLIKDVKKDLGFSGGYMKFLQSPKTKLYLNEEMKKHSSLLIIYGQKYYLIAPRITDI